MGEVGGAGTVFRRAFLNIPNSTPREREREREREGGGGRERETERDRESLGRVGGGVWVCKR